MAMLSHLSAGDTSMYKTVASIAAGLGVAAVATSVLIVKSTSRKRVASFNWPLTRSFGSDTDSTDSACSACTACPESTSLPAERLPNADLQHSQAGRQRCLDMQKAATSPAGLLDEPCSEVIGMREPMSPASSSGLPEEPAQRLRHSLDDPLRRRSKDYTLPEDWAPWLLQPQDVQLCRTPDGRLVSLGRGASGEVFLGLINGVSRVAIKQMPVSDMGEAIREMTLLKNLANTHMVQFQGACIKDGQLLMVQEFCEGGDLHKAVRTKAVTWQKKGAQIAMDVAKGLHFLHCQRVVHLDVKSPNILLTRHGVAKIGDIGMARVKLAGAKSLSRHQITAHGAVGTFAFAAPELLMGNEAGCCEKADIYSFGVVLWELVTGQAAVRGRMRDPRVPEECCAEVATLIDDCMDEEPEKRPSAIQVYEQLRTVVKAQARKRARRCSMEPSALPRQHRSSTWWQSSASSNANMPQQEARSRVAAWVAGARQPSLRRNTS